MTNTDPATDKKGDSFVRMEILKQSSRWANDSYQGAKPSRTPLPPPKLIGAPVAAASQPAPPGPPAPKK